MNQSPFAASIIREAIQGVVGGSLTWLFACTIAGVIPTAATAEGPDDASWVWVFAWLGHLVTAGIAIWGLPILCLHAVCLSALIHGTERAWRIVAVTFISQLTTSAVVVAMFDDQDAFYRVVVVWLACAIPTLTYLIGSFVMERREDLA